MEKRLFADIGTAHMAIVILKEKDLNLERMRISARITEGELLH